MKKMIYNKNEQCKIYKEQMMKDVPETQKELLKEFPALEVEQVRKIDIDIKTQVIKYQPPGIHADISVLLQNEVKKYVKDKNVKKIRTKCNKITTLYLENHRVWNLQENWYCLLAYFIMIITMIQRILDKNQQFNDFISWIVYMVVLVIWGVITKHRSMMGEKAEKFLLAFNHHAPSMIIVSSMLF